MTTVKKSSMSFLDSVETKIYTQKHPGGFTIKSFVIDPCNCKNCRAADPENEGSDDFDELITQYLFQEAQKNVRKAKLELASPQQSYDHSKELIAKKPKH